MAHKVLPNVMGSSLLLGAQHVPVSVAQSAPSHKLLFSTTPSFFLCQGLHGCSTLAWDTVSPFPWLSGPSCLNFNLTCLERLSLVLCPSSLFCLLAISQHPVFFSQALTAVCHYVCICIHANMYHFSVLYSTLNLIK